MILSESVKLYPTSYQKTLIQEEQSTYIQTVNHLVSMAINAKINLAKTTTADVLVNLPSALTNQCIRDAILVFAKANLPQ